MKRNWKYADDDDDEREGNGISMELNWKGNRIKMKRNWSEIIKNLKENWKGNEKLQLISNWKGSRNELGRIWKGTEKELERNWDWIWVIIGFIKDGAPIDGCGVKISIGNWQESGVGKELEINWKN